MDDRPATAASRPRPALASALVSALSPALPAAFAACVTACALLSGLAGCGGAATAADPGEEGQLLVDGNVILDRFAFSRAACDEVLPGAFPALDTVPAGAAAILEVTSIACYAVDVRVEDSLGRAVRDFQAFFDIPGRADDDPNAGNGRVGFVTWDGRDGAGVAVPPGDYLWRLDFRFGAGRSSRFRAVMRLR